MYCNKCGNEISKGALFCTKCGNRAEENEITGNAVNGNAIIGNGKSSKSIVGTIACIAIVAFLVVCVIVALMRDLGNAKEVNGAANTFESEVEVQPSKAISKEKEKAVTKPVEEKYTVNVTARVDKNMMAAKYDIDVYIEGEFFGTLKNGETRNFSFEGTSGRYQIEFKKHDANKILSDEKFDVKDVMIVNADNTFFNYHLNPNIRNLEVNRE